MGRKIRFEVSNNNNLYYVSEHKGKKTRLETTIRLQDFIGLHSGRRLSFIFGNQNELTALELTLS